MILQAIIKERYLFLSALDAIFPCTNDCSFESCRCLVAVLVLCLESCRTVSNLCRGLYKKLSWLKSPTGLKNGAIKLLLVSVPCENQQRFLRTNIVSSHIRTKLQILSSRIRCKKAQFSSFSFFSRWEKYSKLLKGNSHLQNRFELCQNNACFPNARICLYRVMVSLVRKERLVCFSLSIAVIRA